MLDVSFAVIAVLFILLGVRGSYANFWNSLFPHYPISVPSTGSTASAEPNSGPANVQVTQGGQTIQAPVGKTGSTQPVIIGGSVHPIHNVAYAPGGSVNTVQAVVAPKGTPYWICDVNGQNCHMTQ